MKIRQNARHRSGRIQLLLRRRNVRFFINYHRLNLIFTSILIVFILTIQTYAVVGKLSWYWPFVNYDMYSNKKQNGDRVNPYSMVYAKLSNSEEVLIRPQNIGMKHFKFEWNFVRAIKTENMKKLNPMIDLIENRHGQTVTDLIVKDVGVIVTRSGMKKVPPKTIKSFRINQ